MTTTTNEEYKYDLFGQFDCEGPEGCHKNYYGNTWRLMEDMRAVLSRTGGDDAELWFAEIDSNVCIFHGQGIRIYFDYNDINEIILTVTDV